MATSSTQQQTRRFPRAAVALLATGALLLNACGDDDDDSASNAGGADAFLVDAEAICADRSDEIDSKFEALFSEGDPEPAEMLTLVTDLGDTYASSLEEIRDLDSFPADGEVADAFANVTLAMDALRERIDTPEEAAEWFESDGDAAVNEAEEALVELGFSKCGSADESEAFGPDELTPEQRSAATQVPVSATEYSFSGVGETLVAGPVVFTLTNDGATEHEMGMIKVKDGVTAEDAVAAALADSDDDSYIESEFGGAYVIPEDSIEFTGVLEPGLYGYACFIETDDGESHASLGMIGTFTVSG